MPQLILPDSEIQRQVTDVQEIFVVPNDKFYEFAERMTVQYGMMWSEYFVEDDELEDDYEDAMVFVRTKATMLPSVQKYLSQFTGYKYAS